MILREAGFWLEGAGCVHWSLRSEAPGATSYCLFFGASPTDSQSYALKGRTPRVLKKSRELCCLRQTSVLGLSPESPIPLN